MFEQNLIENVSRHRSYVEKGDAIWLRPESKRVTIGEEKLQYVNNPTDNGPTIFHIPERQRAEKKFAKGDISKYELSVSGWGSEHVEKYKSVVEEQARAKKEGRRPQYSGLIEPTDFVTLKSTQRVVAVFTKIEEIHELLSTIRVINIDDLTVLQYMISTV